MRGLFYFLVPKAPQEEVRVQKKKENLTVLSGDKSDGHMSGYCLVVVYSCTYSLDKFHCLWYKTPSGIGNLKEKQKSTLINTGHPKAGLQCAGVARQVSQVVQNPHLLQRAWKDSPMQILVCHYMYK